jgi:transcription initiation factor TFIIB
MENRISNNSQVLQRCTRCGKENIIHDLDTGEIVCSFCGYVILEQMTSIEPEWRNFTNEPNKQRAGSHTTLTRHDMGLSTVIYHQDRDALGRPLTPRMKDTIQRLRVWDNRSHKESFEKNLQNAFVELNKLKDKLVLSDAVIEKAAYIYRKAVENGFTKGRSIVAILAASLYAACRYSEIPRNLNDVAHASNIKRRELSKCYRLLHREFDFKMPVMDPICCVSRIGNTLKISEKSKRFAMSLLQKIQGGHVSAGKDPMALAATAIYIACLELNENSRQRDIAKAANVTEVTIRNRLKTLKPFLEKD